MSEGAVPSVVWVIDGREVYGERRAIVSLASGLAKSGWKVRAISLHEAECSKELRAEGVEVEFIDSGRAPGMHLARSKPGKVRELLRMAGHQRRVGRLLAERLKQRPPDVVHVLNKNILPAVAWAARKVGAVCFWEMTAIVGGQYALDINRRMHRWLFRTFHVRVLANSHYTATTLGDVGVPVSVMHLGVDPARFAASRTFSISRKGLGIPADAVVFTIVARVDSSKGQDVFVEAIAQVGNPRLHLLIVGGEAGSSDVEKIRARAVELKLADRIHFIGRTPEPEAYLAISDIAVNSRVDAEPFGLSTVEAMMMAKPLLVHALGGPAETVVDNEGGWHMQHPTSADYAAGIRRVLADEPRWPAIAAASRGRALEHFSVASQVRTYRAAVEAALAAQRQ